MVMNGLITYSATDFRDNLFEIMNQVFYGNKQVLVTKNNKPMVKLIKPVVEVKTKKKSILDFAGIMDDETYKIMKDVIKKSRKLPARATPVDW